MLGGENVAGLFLGYLLIFLARIFDVSAGTIRVLLIVRGRKWLASSIGFFEVMVYIVVLKHVVDRLNDPLSLIIYCLGFAAGSFVGSALEEKMAMGFCTVQVVPNSYAPELVSVLRDEGYGVTVWEGEGRTGPRSILNIMLHRRSLKRLLNIIREWDREAFVTVLDARVTKGGFFFQRKGK